MQIWKKPKIVDDFYILLLSWEQMENQHVQISKEILTMLWLSIQFYYLSLNLNIFAWENWQLYANDFLSNYDVNES